MNHFQRLIACSVLIISSNAQKNDRRRADAFDDLNLGRGELHLPDGENHVVSCRRTFTEDGGWHGECDGGLDANFVQRQNTITGKASTFGSFHTTGNQICRMAPDAEGKATIQCLSEDELETEEEVDMDASVDDDDDEATHQRKLENFNLTFAMDHVDLTSDNRRRLYDDSGATLDLLVVWTPLAECVNSGMQEGCTLTAQTEANMRGLIDLAMLETNVAFSLSAIRTKLRLVHAYRDDSYSEPKDSSRYPLMLTHLTEPGDGELESVHVNRALYGADLVHMITGSSGACGLARVGPESSKAFSISRFSCATGYYSFGHEIAHTLGAHHDRPSLNRCDSHQDSYNFGYRDPEAQFRTILAYGCRTNQCDDLPKNGCQRVQRFSNGVTEYNGKKLGNAANNNARVINQNSQLIAKWFPAMDCLADGECDDGDASTFDTCNEEKRVCVFTKPNPNINGINVASVQATETTDAPSPEPTQEGVAPTEAPVNAPTKAPDKAPTRAPVKAPTTAPLAPTPSGILVLNLIHAPSNAVLLELSDGAVVDMKDFGVSPEFNIEAVELNSSVVKVNFDETIQSEGVKPFAYCGDNGGDYKVCPTLSFGTNTVTAEGIADSGDTIGKVQVTFQIVDTTPSTPSPTTSPLANPSFA